MNFYTEDIAKGYNWKGLERALARLMGHLGWKDTNVIGGAGDMGGDILGTRIDEAGAKSWVVQSKAVSGDRYIGPQAIKEAIDALTFYQANVAAVATNGEFTKTARQRQAQLESNGYTIKLWNGAFLQALIEGMPNDSAAYRQLRTYQQNIVDKVLRAFDAGEKRSFYIVATGLGKTVIAATIARNLWERGCRRILVLCHATDLAIQLEQGFGHRLLRKYQHLSFSMDYRQEIQKVSALVYIKAYMDIYRALIQNNLMWSLLTKLITLSRMALGPA